MIIKELVDAVRMDEGKRDWVVPAREMSSQNGRISWHQPQMTLPDGTAKLIPGQLVYTDWSLRQLSQRLGVPYGYMKVCPHSLRDTNLNFWLKNDEDAERAFLVREHNGVARAILSERYVPIANSSVIQAVQDVIDDNLRYSCHVDPDYVYIRLMAMNTPDGLYGMGVVVVNGEIGDHALRVAPFVQRHACTNSIVFLEGGLYMRHTNRNSPAYLRATIKEHVGVALGKAPMYLERLISAEVEQIPDISVVIDSICAVRGYNSDIRYQIMVGTEGHSTRAGVANGLSYAAHQVPDMRQTMDLEFAAGSYLLDAPLKVESEE